MRNPPASEIFNEEVSNLLKRKIKSSVSRLDELSIAFDYDGHVTGEDAREILDKIVALHTCATVAAAETQNSRRAEALRLFGANLDTIHQTLPVPGKAQLGVKGSKTDDDFGSFAQAFEAAEPTPQATAKLPVLERDESKAESERKEPPH